VKQQCNCPYVLYIDMVFTALCETAVQLSLRAVLYVVGTAVCEIAVQAVQLSLRYVYRYGGYCCMLNSSTSVGTFCI
jgi:hypothetical protein